LISASTLAAALSLAGAAVEGFAAGVVTVVRADGDDEAGRGDRDLVRRGCGDAEAVAGGDELTGGGLVPALGPQLSPAPAQAADRPLAAELAAPGPLTAR
jgi:hypothetical protein